MAERRNELECWLKPFPDRQVTRPGRGCVRLRCGIDRPWWLGVQPMAEHLAAGRCTVIKLYPHTPGAQPGVCGHPRLSRSS